MCVITPYFGSVERVSCLEDMPASNSAMSDWGTVDAGSHVISCAQLTQATYRKLWQQHSKNAGRRVRFMLCELHVHE